MKTKKKETEVKLCIDKKDVNGIKKRIFSLCGKSLLMCKETTYGYFTPDGKSIERGIFPRIKVIDDKLGTMTVKVKNKPDSEYFERDEFNLALNNIEQGRNILKALGYTDERIFEKRRESWFQKKRAQKFALMNYLLVIFLRLKEVQKK